MAQPQSLDTEATVKQFKEFLLSYNKLSEMCFNDCATDFTTRKVLDSEARKLKVTKRKSACPCTQADQQKLEFNMQPQNPQQALSTDKCSLNCMEKYLKMTQRISLRFQEYQLQQSEGASVMPGMMQR